MFATAGSVAASAGLIVAYGFFLGIGFYASRKATNQIDWLFLNSAEREALRGIA